MIYINVGTTAQADALSQSMFNVIRPAGDLVTKYYCSWVVDPSQDVAWILVPDTLPSEIDAMVPVNAPTATFEQLSAKGFFKAPTGFPE